MATLMLMVALYGDACRKGVIEATLYHALPPTCCVYKYDNDVIDSNHPGVTSDRKNGFIRDTVTNMADF
jgi:hypothetical protein